MNLYGEKNNKSKRNGIGVRRSTNNSLQKVKNEKLSDDAKTIYNLLVEISPDSGDSFRITNERLSDITGIKEYRVSKAFGELRDNGYIICEYKFDYFEEKQIRSIYIP